MTSSLHHKPRINYSFRRRRKIPLTNSVSLWAPRSELWTLGELRSICGSCCLLVFVGRGVCLYKAVRATAPAGAILDYVRGWELWRAPVSKWKPPTRTTTLDRRHADSRAELQRLDSGHRIATDGPRTHACACVTGFTCMLWVVTWWK